AEDRRAAEAFRLHHSGEHQLRSLLRNVPGRRRHSTKRDVCVSTGQAAHVAFNGGKMDGFLWAEWPEALSDYWKGELPQPDPEDVVPHDESTAKEELRALKHWVRDLLQRFDANKNQKLSVEELSKAIADTPELSESKPDPARAGELLRKYDANGDQQLD